MLTCMVDRNEFNLFVLMYIHVLSIDRLPWYQDNHQELSPVPKWSSVLGTVHSGSAYGPLFFDLFTANSLLQIWCQILSRFHPVALVMAIKVGYCQQPFFFFFFLVWCMMHITDLLYPPDDSRGYYGFGSVARPRPRPRPRRPQTLRRGRSTGFIYFPIPKKFYMDIRMGPRYSRSLNRANFAHTN
jgi:hypothetical protein